MKKWDRVRTPMAENREGREEGVKRFELGRQQNFG